MSRNETYFHYSLHEIIIFVSRLVGKHLYQKCKTWIGWKIPSSDGIVAGRKNQKRFYFNGFLGRFTIGNSQIDEFYPNILLNHKK